MPVIDYYQTRDKVIEVCSLSVIFHPPSNILDQQQWYD